MTIFSYFFPVIDPKKFVFFKKEGSSKYFPAKKCHKTLHLTIPSMFFYFLVNFPKFKFLGSMVVLVMVSKDS